ncbi:uncharacterized protein LOC131157584 isoform X2 [Malania oleifera]|uniref:uncharacterized protein LOC131157584 isoform X2 n=1 Tax=Malania oleifera TaxID=397392 RepID=UPI0025AE9500|nr:uncharacterized protein LOC131157584 isoform X2 [Malania oleifera]
MMVANGFDLWQKDTFFSAAEEVQESADIMESAYRTWVRERREGLAEEDVNELCRELQTALGTAKWQLEEFDRAVRLSYRSCFEENTTTRHRQFVAAIQNQISCVEVALKEYLNEDDKEPLQWVNLDEEERSDLVMFLSGTSGSLPTAKDEYVELGPSMKNFASKNQYNKEDVDLDFNSISSHVPDEIKGFKDVVSINKDGKYIIELAAKEIPVTRDDLNCQADKASGSRRTWSSPNFGALKIVIADEDEQRKASMSSVEATPKEKGAKPMFWKQWFRGHSQAKGGIPSYIQLRGFSWINQLFGRVTVFQRQLQGPQYLQFSCSVRLMLGLMLTIFLIVPFVLYST